MSTLPLFLRTGAGRFDFRVPDGLGRFVYPDLEDPDLKVEFRDSTGALRLTATIGGQPALAFADDYDETANPEGGPYVEAAIIPLADFALGVAEARVYAKVEGVEVRPYPTLLEAFEVIADAGQGPLYALLDRVKAEIPGVPTDTISDEMVLMAVAEASRQIDAALAACYEVPFPDIGLSPATPPVVESICRRLAAGRCLQWMGRVNAAAETEPARSALRDLESLALRDGRAPASRLPAYQGPLAVQAGRLLDPEAAP